MVARSLLALPMAVVLSVLSACQQPGMVTSPTPSPRPASPEVTVAPRSAESEAVRRHFAALQSELLTQGLLRQDGGGPDTQFSRNDLVENFIRIALYDEYVISGGRLIARQTASKLRKFRDPVRFGVHFGGSISRAQQDMDRASVSSYARRLARATRHPITAAQTDANFLVLILNEDERRSFGPQLKRLMPEISDRDTASILSMPRSTLCHVFAWDPNDDGVYKRAVAVIRGEHPNLTRLSCIHEELAQGLGLANDSRGARPSIFNDDEEFGLLTSHDELLLRILYDARLTPGITPDGARPVVESIAAELLGGST